jgi:succinyl-CoA synthetase beta subunit
MKIHEYQAKAILARHGVPVPRGEVASPRAISTISTAASSTATTA